MKMSITYTMSIEAEEGKAWQHGFHLGTEEALARQIVEEKFQARVKHDLPVVTIALLRDRKVVDVFDGRWFNSYSAFPFEEDAA
jgi:hypothetical protein